MLSMLMSLTTAASANELLSPEEIQAFRQDLELTKSQLSQNSTVSLPDQVERRLKKLAAFEAQLPSSKVQSIPGATFTEEEVLALEKEDLESDSVSLNMSGLKKPAAVPTELPNDLSEKETEWQKPAPRRNLRQRSR